MITLWADYVAGDKFNNQLSRKLTFENNVFPVPGGPCNNIFLYTPLFCFVFLVAIAMSRTLSSREG